MGSNGSNYDSFNGVGSEEKEKEGLICLCVTTYLKNEALIKWLESAKNFGKVGIIHIADDANFNAQPVAEEYQDKFEKGEYPYQIFYSSGNRKGISVNKNRSLHFFLTSEYAAPYKYLILSDDDIVFNKRSVIPGLPIKETIGETILEAHRESGILHNTAYLGGWNAPLTGDFLNHVFGAILHQGMQIISETETIWFYPLSQGILLSVERSLAEAVGYFDRTPSHYGYEHSLYSSRCMRMMGRTSILYPVVKGCHNYITCANIPNNYEAKPQENHSFYEKRKIEIYSGVGLTVKNPGF